MKSLHVLLVVPGVLLLALAVPADEAPVARIAFGSCARENMPQPIWREVLAADPQLFLFNGDNIYADTTSPRIMREKYALLDAQPGYRKLREHCPVLATWDDHDYGSNDVGREYPMKELSEEIFLDFFNEPADSERRKHPGTYDDAVWGPEGRRLQVILLDTRYFRDLLKRKTKADRAAGSGPYAPWDDSGKTLLGKAQWTWLEAALRKPAELRLIASSIQVVSGEHGWETWGNFPHERDRLFRLIGSTGAGGVLFLSGDRHLAELSCDRRSEGGPYPLYDLTSSGLTNYGGGHPDEPNRHRLLPIFQKINFGTVTIDWDQPGTPIHLRIHDDQGRTVIQHSLLLEQVQP